MVVVAVAACHDRVVVAAVAGQEVVGVCSLCCSRAGSCLHMRARTIGNANACMHSICMSTVCNHQALERVAIGNLPSVIVVIGSKLQS